MNHWFCENHYRAESAQPAPFDPEVGGGSGSVICGQNIGDLPAVMVRSRDRTILAPGVRLELTTH